MYAHPPSIYNLWWATSPPQVEVSTIQSFAIGKLPGTAAALPVAAVSVFGSPPLQRLRDLSFALISHLFSAQFSITLRFFVRLFLRIALRSFVDDSVSQDIPL